MIDTAGPSPSPRRSSRCWTLQSPDGAIDVQVTAHDADALSAVLPELASVVGRAAELWSGSTRLTGELPLTAPGLRHGAVLGLGRAGPTSPDRDSRALQVQITGGPDAGRTIPLEQGRHVLGRGTGAGIRFDDPDVSRRHAVIQIGNGEVTVADLGSTNGTLLDGAAVDGTPLRWPAGGRLRLGATTATLTAPGHGRSVVEHAGGGRVVVRPVPRLSTPPADAEVAFPRAPDAPARRRLPWAAAALPAVGGAVMAVVLHTPTFLFFAVLSPLVAVGSWVSDRWTARRSGKKDAATHAADLAAAHQRLDDAVRADVRDAEAAAPDLPTLATAARRRAAPLWSRRSHDADAAAVRLGTGPGTTRVIRVDGDGSRTPVTHPHVPVTLDLRSSGGLGIVGPRAFVLSVLAGVLAQLVTLHAPGEVELLLLAAPHRLADWRWTRWLPHLSPGATAPTGSGSDLVERLLAGRHGESSSGWAVVLVDGTLDARLAARLRSARESGVVVLCGADRPDELPVDVEAVLSAAGEVAERGVLARDGATDTAPFVVDRLSTGTAAALARDLAGLVPARSGGELPTEVGLTELPAPGLQWDGREQLTGGWDRRRDVLAASIGRTARGPLLLDLCRDGPHALVAGTTGSGKSELLQTLIASLALTHPPDRCSFLLVDYKGGAAFAEAADLPHTVGVLTDLDGQSTARALRSLTAELVRRERVLAEHGVSDLAALSDDVPLPRLVIVVDEFATLAGELPSFVPGLVAIAQRGRSLGIHLVLATQRPAGVVSPEIRANCTLRICLRTTDDADSRDVLGVPDAAWLPVDVPGRAFLRSGGGSPIPFQVARVRAGEREDAPPQVGRWNWPLLPGTPAGRRGAGSDLGRVVAAIGRAAAQAAAPAPHRPWLPPLPERVTRAALAAGPERRIAVGLVDRPDLQSREVLGLDLDTGGTWLAVGGPRSGRTTLLRTVLDGAVAACSPPQLHVHVLDHGGGALSRAAAALPHAGTCLDAEDPLRTVRLVARLAEEVSARRSGLSAGPLPRLLLVVDGAESVLEQLDDSDPTGGSTAFLRLLREGAAVGLTCVMTADRAVPGGRLAAAATERLVLPLADRADYAVAGISATAVPAARPPGRALLGDRALECQLALPDEPLGAGARAGICPAGTAALRIVELPADPVLTDDSPTAAGILRVSIGPGGDDGRPLQVDLGRTGGLLVVGPAGSGRSSLLDALVSDLTRRGVPVLRIGRRSPPGRDDGAPRLRVVGPRDVEAAAEWLSGSSGPTVVVADDVGAAVDWPVLAALTTGCPGRPPVLVAAGTAAELTGHYQGAVAGLRRGGSGLLLCPRIAEADVLGVRLPRTAVPMRPGSGWLVSGGRLERVQVARHRPAAGRP